MSPLSRKAAQKPKNKTAGLTKKSAQRTVKKQSEKTPSRKQKSPRSSKPATQSQLLTRILASLDDDKAENVITINLEGRSALCDAAVIASGRSSRHVGAMAEHLARRLKEGGYGTRPISGQVQGDWVLVDAGDVVVHIFRPEVRDYYDLEGMWSVSGRTK